MVSGTDFDAAATVTVGGVAATCTVVTADTITCDFPDNAGTAAAVDVTVTNPGDVTDTLTGGFTYTGVLADPGASFFCNLQFPTTITTTAGVTTGQIFGQIFVAGQTDASNMAVPGLLGQVGYGADGSDPTAVNWDWTDMAANSGYDFSQNNDEQVGTLTVGSTGTYDYATRFSEDGGVSYTYCDTNGSDDGYAPANAGDLTVN